jgi:RND family efflux transporter MFP subunit
MKILSKKLVITLGAAGVLILALLYVMSSGGPSRGPQKGGPKGPAQSQASANQTATKKPALKAQAKSKEASVLPVVGVVPVELHSYRALVTGYGEVLPQFNLTMTARISGRVDKLADRFFTGAQLHNGELLAQLDKTDYQEALATAVTSVEDAKVALEEERLLGIQARQEWQRSGLSGEPSSPLVLRTPQLKAAEASLREAEAEVETAMRDLANTQISAPFNALVVSREIQPGSYLQSGSEIATLYSTDKAEIAVPLAANQWRNLPVGSQESGLNWPVTLHDMDGINSWTGYVSRIEQHLDSTTRQRVAVVTVDEPLNRAVPLYFGTYVTADISGIEWDNIWQVPASAISQKQELWYVNGEQQLAKVIPEVIFQANDHTYIKPIEGMSDAQIVARPLSSFLVGTKVQPKTEGASL